MLAEFGISLPDHARLISTSEVETGEWVDSVSQVLGESKLDEAPAETMTQRALYFLKASHYSLTLTRNIQSDDTSLMMNLQMQGDAENTFCLHISSIFKDEITNNIYFVNANPQQTEPDIVSISSLGQIVFYN